MTPPSRIRRHATDASGCDPCSVCGHMDGPFAARTVTFFAHSAVLPWERSMVCMSCSNRRLAARGADLHRLQCSVQAEQ